MHLGIDATNIRAGGAIVHLEELMRMAKPAELGFSKVIIWGGREALSKIDDHAWLVKSHQFQLDRSLPMRTFWQCTRLSMLARKEDCDVILVLSGSYAGNFHCPMVTMCRNLLTFDWQELRRNEWPLWSLTRFKLMLLRWTQSRTFRRSDGLIYLTKYTKNAVGKVLKTNASRTKIIPLGVDTQFVSPPREQLPVSYYSANRPFRILYVSIVHVYKHQWHAAKAVEQLRQLGLPIVLDLVGPAYPPALARLRSTLDSIDSSGNFVRYWGAVDHDELHERYAQADMFLFASSCETWGQILSEAMASGLPIACSNRSAMQELLGNAGLYFDPENPRDIASVLLELIESPELRAMKAKAAFERVQTYTWERCAHETFSFLAEVASNGNH